MVNETETISNAQLRWHKRKRNPQMPETRGPCPQQLTANELILLLPCAEERVGGRGWAIEPRWGQETALGHTQGQRGS